MVGDQGYSVDGVVHSLVVAALQQADGDYHVQLVRTQPEQRCGLVAQRGHQRRSQREADHHTHGNAGAGKHAHRRRNPYRVHHGAGKAVADCLIAQAFYLVAGGLGLQQRVVDDGGQRLPARQRFRGKADCIEAAVVKLQIGILNGGGRSHASCSFPIRCRTKPAARRALYGR